MLLDPRLVLMSVTLLGLAALTSCANSPMGKTLEESVAPDPQLQTTPTPRQVSPSLSPSPSSTPSPDTSEVKLPRDFPSDIPRYGKAELQEARRLTSAEAQVQTRWVSSDPSNLIQNFYQKELAAKNWKITRRPSEEGRGTLTAVRDSVQVDITFQVNQKPGGATEFTIEYGKGDGKAALVPSPKASPTTVAATPTPATNATPDNSPTSPGNSDVPQALRQYVADVVKLGVLKSPDSANVSENFLEPNKIITRRLYARWLVEANNKINGNRPAKQIRLSVASSQPTFKDVPNSDPDFPIIQGLAEAGLISSALSGDATATQFRPDAPLTREDLILWKVPLDISKVLPNATVDAVKERWGFQDAAKIDSKALRAILADFDNGDFANIRRVLGFTTLFQPKKSVTRAEAAAALWYFGFQGDGLSAADVLKAAP